jgi:hypothetical protein
MGLRNDRWGLEGINMVFERRPIKLFLPGLLAAGLLFQQPVSAIKQTEPATQTDWRKLALGDVAAVSALIQETHPAIQPEVDDSDFVDAFQRAKAIAEDFAARTTSEAGYRASLNAFAAALGDPHFAARFKNPVSTYAWPGFSMRYIGSRFAVGAVANAELPLREGDVLQQCDGIDALELGKRRLGAFRAVWSLGAERTRWASSLLFDDGNPFLERPTSCTFTQANGRPLTLKLTWSAIEANQLSSIVRAERQKFGVAKNGLTIAGGAAWIGMERMDETADPTIAAVRKERSSIRAAKGIVIDLRGNGGGDSKKGDQLIEALFGKTALAIARKQTQAPVGRSHWRATPLVLETIENFAKERATTYGENSEDARGWREEAAQMRLDIAAGYSFSPPIPAGAIGADAPAKHGKKPPALAHRVFVLTDSTCISSCLMLVGSLKTLGAYQIGWETNASRRYMEVRSFPLPSGLASFSSLQKVSFGFPNWLGPFVPDIPASPYITDAQALEAFAMGLAVPDPNLMSSQQ